MTIVWNTLLNHNGYIDLITGEEGTTFNLFFPITRDAVKDGKESVSLSEYKGSGQTVLVVDDMEDQRKVACRMLKKLGYNPFAVSSGEEAVAYLENHTVDILLLDMIMDPGNKRAKNI